MASQTDSGIINNSTLLPLSLFIGGIAFTAALTWRTSSAKSELQYRLQEIERRLKAIEEQGDGAGLETRIDHAESTLRDIKKRRKR